MTTKGTEIDLQAVLPVAELARLQRRLVFLEAALVQVMRDERGLREWFSGAELAELRLPGLPATARGIGRVAREQGWECRRAHGRPSDRLVYHFSSLPRVAFSSFIERVLKGRNAGRDDDAAVAEIGAPDAPRPALAAPPALPAQATASTTPAWLLPLMRILRAGGGPLANAVAELPRHLAPGVPAPSLDEARALLARIAAGGE